jgi:hypothetical protein
MGVRLTAVSSISAIDCRSSLLGPLALWSLNNPCLQQPFWPYPPCNYYSPAETLNFPDILTQRPATIAYPIVTQVETPNTIYQWMTPIPNPENFTGPNETAFG